jgi:hypothetical protein
MLQPLQRGQNHIKNNSETKNPYTEHKIDPLQRLNQDSVIVTGLKDRKSINKNFQNLVLIEYLKLMENK